MFGTAVALMVMQIRNQSGYAGPFASTERRNTMLKKFRKGEKGFTLIELLIVVAIIGILAAIAIPQFSAYRQKAYNSAAQSDLKNFKTAMEAYYADNQAYPAGM